MTRSTHQTNRTAPHLAYRPDIDGLRAMAVGGIVVFHAFPTLLSGGFAGVDVFFVISGFLITSIIARNLAANTFSFADFYARRIRRIFPALIAMLVACYVFGWVFLMPAEYMQLGRHIAAGAGFLSNVLSFHEAGYFDVASESKPLLHLWSLGIEEQFYIAWPLIAYAACRTRTRLIRVASLLALLSFAANVYLVHRNAVATFYLPGTRAWELMLGCMLACMEGGRIPGVTRSWQANAVSVAGAALLVLALSGLSKNDAFPGWYALLPTVGALLVMGAGPLAWLNRRVLSARPLVWIGLISFPLYLWHWPLLAFARVVSSGEPPAGVRAALVAAAVVLAWLTYVLIERPVRLARRKAPALALLCSLMVLCAGVGWKSFDRKGLEFRQIARLHRDISDARKWDFWTDAACVRRYGVEPCETSIDPPDVMLLGDSHANHLYPGLAKGHAMNVMDVGTCWPLDGVLMGISKNQAIWPCSNRDTFAFAQKLLQANPSVKTVVIAGWWGPVLDGGMRTPDFERQWGGYLLLPQLPGEAGMSLSELTFRGLSRTVSYLEEKHLNVVVVLDAPYVEQDLAEYCALGSRFRAYSDCSVPRPVVDARRAKGLALMQRLQEAHPRLVLFDPVASLCDADRCYLRRDHKLLYRDGNHLSYAGSIVVGQRLSRLLGNLSSNPGGR